MLSDPEVRLPGVAALRLRSGVENGIEVPDDLLAQIEKLCTT